MARLSWMTTASILGTLLAAGCNMGDALQPTSTAPCRFATSVDLAAEDTVVALGMLAARREAAVRLAMRDASGRAVAAAELRTSDGGGETAVASERLAAGRYTIEAELQTDPEQCGEVDAIYAVRGAGGWM